MSRVLYQKYRPQTFDEVVGQASTVQILKNSVSQDKVGHAYMFSGPRGTGKTSTARLLAKAVNCLSPDKDGNPDNSCEICQAIDEGRLIDLVEIDAASNRGIDEMRELKERINFSPTQARYKVYIIDEVHMLTKEAFNALLKTLEEPPAHAIFILATTESHKVPATILSRTQRFDFKLGTKADVLQNMQAILKKEGVKIEDGGLELIYDASGGSYRDAQSVLEMVVRGQAESKDPETVTTDEIRQILGLPDDTMVYYLLDNLVKGKAEEALNLIGEVSVKGIDLHQFVHLVLDILRKCLVSKIKGEELPHNCTFAEGLSTAEIVKMISHFVNADNEIKYAAIPTLPLEMVVARYVSGESEGSGSGEDNRGDKRLPGKNKKKSAKGNLVKKVSQKIKDVRDSVVVSSLKAKSANLDLAKIKKTWPEIISGVKPFNGFFYMFLSKAELRAVDDESLSIAVPFSFHKDRILEPANIETLSGVMKKVWGKSLRIQCEVDESMSRPDLNVSSIIASGKEKMMQEKVKEESRVSEDDTTKTKVDKMQKLVSKNDIRKDKDINPEVMEEILDVFV